VLLYDHLKSAVLERQGEAIRFHLTLLALAAAWCRGQAADRPCPEDRTLTVREAFAQEQPRLLALPDTPFPTDERVEVKVGKTPSVRFDLNDDSRPYTHVQRLVTVVASPEQVRVLDGATVLACHPRRYDQGAQIEDEAHVAELTARQRAARHHRGQDRLAQAAPNRRDRRLAAAARGENLGALTAALRRLLDADGAAELQAAISEALQREVPHPNAVRLSLERRREQRDQPPPVPLTLPDDPREHLWARYGLRIQDFQAEHDVTQANHAERDLFDPGDPIDPF
jgi:hypothetical protein